MSVYTCNACKGLVETMYHCTVCDDFDLCIQCYEKEGHPHKMNKLGLDLDDGCSTSDQKECQDMCMYKCNTCKEHLGTMHYCTVCDDFGFCLQCNEKEGHPHKMDKLGLNLDDGSSTSDQKEGQDRFVYTCNACKGHVETRYHCTVCDDFDLCAQCYEKEGHPHKMDKLGLDLDDGSSPSDQKQVPKCMVPFCSHIKYKMKQQQLQQRLQQAQLLRRRMAVTMPTTSKDGSQVQEEARQQQVNVNTLYPNKIPSMPPRLPLKPLLVDQWPQQRNPPVAQRPSMVVGNVSMIGASTPGVSTMQQSGGGAGGVIMPSQPPPQVLRQSPPTGANSITQRTALQQLLNTLKSPATPEQQQQILQILKSKPQLMAAFIKQPQAQQQQQQQEVVMPQQPGAPGQQQQQQQQQQQAAAAAACC